MLMIHTIDLYATGSVRQSSSLFIPRVFVEPTYIDIILRQFEGSCLGQPTNSPFARGVSDRIGRLYLVSGSFEGGGLLGSSHTGR